jgi:hypothetical protein
MDFELAGGKSLQVFDGTLVRIKGKCIVYRISVTAFAGAELKVITTGGKNVTLTADAVLPVIDIAAWGALYLEATGPGSVAGRYEALFGI